MQSRLTKDMSLPPRSNAQFKLCTQEHPSSGHYG